MKKTLLLALIISGATLFAGTSFNLKMDKGNKFLKESNSLSFRKPVSERNVLNLKNTRFSASGRNWEESEVTGGGLFINFGINFPSAKFLNPWYTSGDTKFKLGFDFEIGNYFRFAKIQEGKMGIGLRVTWLSFTFNKMVDNKDVYRALQISPLRFGPQFGYAITENMGFDVFYQWGFNFTDMFGNIDSPGNSTTIGENIIYTGGSHEIGAAFHFNVFSVGFGYRFGKLTAQSYVYDGTEDTFVLEVLQTQKHEINNFRITLGFKF